MSDDDHGEDGYRVGYGRPPKATRFKPGNQAAKGRRVKPKDDSLAGYVRNEMLTPGSVMINGRRKRMTGMEIFVKRLANTAKSGNTKDAIAAMKYLQELSPQPLEEYIPDELVIRYVMPTMSDPRLKKNDPEK